MVLIELHVPIFNKMSRKKASRRSRIVDVKNK